MELVGDGFSRGKNDRKHAVYCVLQGFILGVITVVSCCFPILLGESEVV